MVDLRYPLTLWKQDRIEAAILAITVLVTLTVSLPMGIGVASCWPWRSPSNA